MAGKSGGTDPLIARVRAHVGKYAAVKGNYEIFAEILGEILRRAVRQLGVHALVEARAKTIPSFAEKIVRKPDKTDPTNQFTDLCGSRVITDSQNQIDAVCDFITRHFEIDESNSEDVRRRLGTSQFGYQSIHFIVSLREEDVEDLLGENYPGRRESLQPLYERRTPEEVREHKLPPGPKYKAEIQVRTLLQHAWAVFGHDRLYKAESKVPEQYERDANRISATLEEADEAIARTIDAVESYRSYYGSYMKPEERQQEIEKLSAVLESIPPSDSDRRRLAHRIARIAASLQQWDFVCETLEGFVDEWHGSAPCKEFRKNLSLSRQGRNVEVQQRALAKLQRLRNPQVSGVLMEHAWALWKRGDQTGNAKQRKAGRDGLQESIDLDPANVDARVFLADGHMREGVDRALEYYEAAFETDPSHPTALGGFLYCKLAVQRNLDFLPLMLPTLKAAVHRCRELVRLNVAMPQAFYDMGFFLLLMDRPYDSLEAYARAVALSDSEIPLERPAERLRELEPKLRIHHGRAHHLPELQWIVRFFAIAYATKLTATETQLDKQLEECRNTCRKREAELEGLSRDASPEDITKANSALEEANARREETEKRLREVREKVPPGWAALERMQSAPEDRVKFESDEKVVIVAGGCDKTVEDRMREYQSLLETALAGFHGTICCGGTKAGISGLVGDLEPPGSDPNAVRKVSYLPALPVGMERHRAYEVCPTRRGDFSAFEPLQNWIDMLAAGVKPEEVKLLGINGGVISRAEYCMALAFGAKVAVLPESGRAAADLAEDADWKGTPNLFRLPFDPQTVWMFVHGLPEPSFKAAMRESLAKESHGAFRDQAMDKVLQKEPNLTAWEKLRQDFKDSNYSQVDFFPELLRAVGLEIRRVGARPKRVYKLTPEQIEIMAEIEHGRWNMERLLEGWVFGPVKDQEKKISPYLIAWRDLPNDIQKFDRDVVARIPERLARFGFDVGPPGSSATPKRPPAKSSRRKGAPGRRAKKKGVTRQ
jgi:ppGpp synthetase/RelA/SpoT-type nucleotidyltranferase